jgi:hypothetical protein
MYGHRRVGAVEGRARQRLRECFVGYIVHVETRVRRAHGHLIRHASATYACGWTSWTHDGKNAVKDAIDS